MSEETVVSLAKPLVENKKLVNITADLLYGLETQPFRVARVIRGVEPRFFLSAERKMSLLVACLLYYPKELETTFNIEVRAPYDYEVEHFAKEFVKELNLVLDKGEGITEEQIMQVKEETYKKSTYNYPINSILRELEVSQQYVTYLMNVEDKITVSKEELETAERIKSFIPKNEQRLDPECELNTLVTGEISKVFGISERFMLVSSLVPGLLKLETRHLLYVSYVPAIKKGSLNFDSILEKTYLKYDIGIANLALKLTKEDSVKILVVDYFGNHLPVVVSEKSINACTRLTESQLENAYSSIITGPSPKRNLSMRLGLTGSLTI